MATKSHCFITCTNWYCCHTHPPPSHTHMRAHTYVHTQTNTHTHTHTHTVFEETIYRSPETMKEMDDTLHTIADKYARRIAAIQAVKESRSPKVGAEPNTQLELKAEMIPPMVTPCESLSEECPLPQLHTQSQDASTASTASTARYKHYYYETVHLAVHLALC